MIANRCDDKLEKLDESNEDADMHPLESLNCMRKSEAISFGILENDSRSSTAGAGQEGNTPDDRCFDMGEKDHQNPHEPLLERKKTAEFEASDRFFHSTGFESCKIQDAISPTFLVHHYKAIPSSNPGGKDNDPIPEIEVTSSLEEEVGSENEEDEKELSFNEESKSKTLTNKADSRLPEEVLRSLRQIDNLDVKKNSTQLDSSPKETASIHERMQSYSHEKKQREIDQAKLISTHVIKKNQTTEFYSTPDLLPKDKEFKHAPLKQNKNYDRLRVEVEGSSKHLPDSQNGDLTEDNGKSMYSEMSEMKDINLSPFQRISPSAFRRNAPKFQLNLNRGLSPVAAGQPQTPNQEASPHNDTEYSKPPDNTRTVPSPLIRAGPMTLVVFSIVILAIELFNQLM